MRRRIRGSLTILVVALFMAAAGAGEAARLPSEQDTWVRGTSAHFVFYSNAGERRVRQLARELENLVDLLARKRGAKASPVPTSVFVFRDDRSLEPYKLNADGSVKALSGFFAQHALGNYVALDGGAETPRLILHEYLHQFTAYNFPPLPVWFDEGLAEFYSTFKGTDLTAELGRPVAEHVHWLRQNPLIPLRRLFAVAQNDPEYNEGERQGVFYAQSWALVHLLTMGREERRPQAAEFVERLARGESPQEALVAFGDLDVLEKELREYVRQKAFTFATLKFAERTVDVAVRFEPVPRADLLFRLGDLLLRTSERSEDAVAHFRAALALVPEHAGALAGLAFVDLGTGRWEQAVSGFARAVAAAPDDPDLRLRLAEALYSAEVEGTAPRMRGEVPERIQQAREHAARAVALRPEEFQGQYLLGLSYGFQVDGVEPGIAALERAGALAPGRLDVQLALGSLQAVAGRYGPARLRAEEVRQRSSDPEEVARARELLAEITVNEAFEEASRTQDYSGAAAAIRRVLPDLPPERREAVESILARFATAAGETTAGEPMTRPPLDLEDAEAHLQYAIHRFEASAKADEKEGARLSGEAVQHFRRAADLDPSRHEAWFGIALACQQTRCGRDEGLMAAEKGVALQPGDVWGSYVLANYRIDAGQYEPARQLLVPFLDADHPMRDELRFTHVRARVEQAESLLRGGKAGEALRVLRGGPLPEGERGKEAREWIAHVREGAELRHWSDRLVAGSEARQKGEPEKARKILEDIIANCPDKELAKMADQELAYIRAASKFK